MLKFYEHVAVLNRLEADLERNKLALHMIRKSREAVLFQTKNCTTVAELLTALRESIEPYTTLPGGVYVSRNLWQRYYAPLHRLLGIIDSYIAGNPAELLA
jgi:hypothetical protein